MTKQVTFRMPNDLKRSIEANKLLTESFSEAVRRHLKQGVKVCRQQARTH